MSEIEKLFEATKPFRDEIAKLQAEVVNGKTRYGCLKIQEEAALKERDSALLQISEWDGEVRKALRLRATCGPRSGPFDNQMGKLYAMLKTNEECMCTGEPPAGCVSTNCRADKKRPSNETSTSEYSSARARLQRGECSRCGSPGCCECT